MRRYSIQVRQQLSSVTGEGLADFLNDSDDDDDDNDDTPYDITPPQSPAAPKIVFTPRKRKAELSLSDDDEED